MERIDVDANTKGAIGEAAIFGGDYLSEPIRRELTEFTAKRRAMEEKPNPRTSVTRDVYFKATTEKGDPVTWEADARITLKWVSPEEQTQTGEQYRRPDSAAVFPVDVKTGEYAELERSQLTVARAIGNSPNDVFPTVIAVKIGDLPESYDVSVRIFGRDFE